MNNEIELVYMVPYLGMKPSRNTLKIRYKRLTGVTGTHTVSPDKLRVNNCYDQLEEGKSYVVISKVLNPEAPEGQRHWVWTECFELLDDAMAKNLNARIRRIDPDSRIPGYITTQRAFNTARFQIQQAHKIKVSQQTTQKLIEELFEF